MCTEKAATNTDAGRVAAVTDFRRRHWLLRTRRGLGGAPYVNVQPLPSMVDALQTLQASFMMRSAISQSVHR